MSLTDREREVLTSIIEIYIDRAAPVSSGAAARQSGLGLSPASIRAIMADLTERGYLDQPHASAGRVPTALAFRSYLNSEMRPRPLSEEQKKRIADDLDAPGQDLGDILKRASKVLAGSSLQVGMVIAPRHASVRWKRIEFALIKPGLVMAVLILQGGLVAQRLIVAPSDVGADDLATYSNYLNHLFKDLSVSEVRARLASEIAKAERALNELYLTALSFAVQAFENERAPEVIVDGATNVLTQPEFADIKHMRDLLSVLEDRSRLLELLDRTMDEYRTMVVIGGESAIEDFIDFGMISSPYGLRGRPLGAVGLLGPLRMDYARLVPVVNYTASLLTRILERHF